MVAGLVLSGCVGPPTGASLAQDLAAGEAEDLHVALGHRKFVRDAEYIAATEVPEGTQSERVTIRREPLAWSGRTFGDERATIDIRFVVTVSEESVDAVGARGGSGGEATRCYRYLLQLHRYTSYQEIECPAVDVPPIPTAAPLPSLPKDAEKRLTRVLQTATPDTLADAVRAAFPQEHLTVDTATHEGALVVTVGIPAERECLLMVRTPAGTIKEPGYDRIWLEPGEMGCRTGLYVSPPR